MPFILIKGRYHVANYAPDGDTVRFEPDNPATLQALGGAPARLNARGHAALRLEGIDTLETHYNGLKQPAALADGATDFLLEGLGIRNVVWSYERRAVASADDQVPGYILARETDRYRRIIAFAYAGGADEADGSELFVDGSRLSDSMNMKLAASGMAYPTFYWGLFADLRAVISAAAVTARKSGAGVYAEDATNAGFAPVSVKALTDDIVVLPKMFRRLSVYMIETGSADGFKAALEASAEPVLDLTSQNITHFDTFVEQENGRVRLTRRPEDLVFDPMPQRIGTDFAALVRAAADPAALPEVGMHAAGADIESQKFLERVAALRSLKA